MCFRLKWFFFSFAHLFGGGRATEETLRKVCGMSVSHNLAAGISQWMSVGVSSGVFKLNADMWTYEAISL